ncbi:hypothetical protein Q3G72_027849 [Acer saccharum]|nr:hypothetical protein Q3G72_027849 [Acer saccharum]
MSMVFTVVLLKSAALPNVHEVGYGIWAIGKALKNWAASEKFFAGDKLIFQNPDVKHVTKKAYKSCDALNDIQDLITDANGQIGVNLNLTGDYYFISPDYDNCKRGLKFSISVSATPGASPSPTPLESSSPAVSVGVLVPMMAVVMGFFF